MTTSSAWAGVLRSRRAAVIAAIVVTVAVALTVVGATVGAGKAPPRNLGQAKPFSLSVLGKPGEHLSLRSLAGRPVILNFFASWCTPCQKETPLIARYYRASQGKVTIVGIDVNDSTGAAESFIHSSGVGYPVAVDPMPMTTATAYGLPGLPATFWLNARHHIVKRVFGAVTEAELADGAALMTRRPG